MDEARETVTLVPCPHCRELRSNRFSHDCRQLQIDRLKAQLEDQAKLLEEIRQVLVGDGIVPPGWGLI